MQIIDLADKLPRGSKRYKTRPIAAISKIVVHHSATTSGTPEAFARYHVEDRRWPGIGYHYVIDKQGRVYKTNHADVISYHASGINSISLGVCLVGNFDVEQPPAAQWQALVGLLKDLMAAYGVKPHNVIGHREVPAPKSCPGRNIDMDALRREIGG